MKYTHLNNDQVHQVGIYIAATAAVLQGHSVEVVPEERRYRLRIDGQLVQVFTRRAGDWQPNAMQPVADNTEGVIFLDLATDEPEFYVVAGDWLRDDVAKHYGDYLAAHGGTRRDNPESRHHKVTTKRVAQWRDRWDVLRSRLVPVRFAGPPTAWCPAPTGARSKAAEFGSPLRTWTAGHDTLATGTDSSLAP